jgi:hypothetical protein
VRECLDNRLLITDVYSAATTRAEPDSSNVLPERLLRLKWHGQIMFYCSCYIAFCAAAVGNWATVKTYINNCNTIISRLDVSLHGPMESVAIYLAGVYHQGTGDLEKALRIFQNPKLEISAPPGKLSSARQVEHDFALLAALNSLWILQKPHLLDTSRNTETLAKLKDLCQSHPNKDIQTAFNLAAATVETTNPRTTLETKSHLSAALKGAQIRANLQFICITLVVMCGSFFANVVGEQAEKSALAASVQSHNAKNKLWMSVADGMLAHCYQINGKTTEAEDLLRGALEHAENSMPGP